MQRTFGLMKNKTSILAFGVLALGLSLPAGKFRGADQRSPR